MTRRQIDNREPASGSGSARRIAFHPYAGVPADRVQGVRGAASNTLDVWHGGLAMSR